MKLALTLLILVVFSACSSPSAEGQKLVENQQPKIENRSKQTVLVELFTSEGCSSCPPADRALAFLQKQQTNPDAEVITLGLHVTYWDDLGWKDQFSSPMFTQRQELYSQKFQLDSIYTPQMVVDGEYQFVGSDLTKAEKVISESAKTKKAKVEINDAADKLKINISEIPEHKDASIYLAIVEDNITTNVKRGENSGKTLEHSSIARSLQSIGIVNPQNDRYEIEYAPQVQAGWKKGNLRYVVFIQENNTRKILGVDFLKAER